MMNKNLELEVPYQTRARTRGGFTRLSKEIIQAELEEDCHQDEDKIDKPTSTKSIKKAIPKRKRSRPRFPKQVNQRPKLKVKKKYKGKTDDITKSENANGLNEELKLQISSLSEYERFFSCPKCCKYFKKEELNTFATHLKEVCITKKQFPCAKCGHIYTNKAVLSYHIEFSHDKPHPMSKTIRVKPRKEYVSEMTRIYENVQQATKVKVASQTEGENRKDKGPILVASSSSTSQTPPTFPTLLEKITKELEDDLWPQDKSAAESLGKSSGTWKCWICFYESCKKSFWMSHLSRVHPEAQGKSVTCPHCKFPFKEKHHLREHLQEVHYDKTGHVCDLCGKKFSKKSQHSCQDILEINCDICEKSFASESEKSKHLLSHSEHRPYSCKVCSKTFKKAEYLSLHMRIHNDERPYECQLCSKKFRTKTHLNNHSRLHSGVKPYICHSCGKTFNSPQRLRDHFLSTHEDKTFACEKCDKTFKTAYDLKRHKAIHSGLKPFQCRICAKTFNRKANCLVHEKIHADALFQNGRKLEITEQVEVEPSDMLDIGITNQSFVLMETLEIERTELVLTEVPVIAII